MGQKLFVAAQNKRSKAAPSATYAGRTARFAPSSTTTGWNKMRFSEPYLSLPALRGTSAAGMIMVSICREQEERVAGIADHFAAVPAGNTAGWSTR